MDGFWENERAKQEPLFVWAPVWLALGIGAYFALTVEPPPAAAWMALVAAVGLGLFAYRRASAVLASGALILLGFGWAQLSPLSPGTPMLAKPLGPVTVVGEVAGLEPMERGGAARVLIRPSAIERLDGPLPRTVRLRVHDATGLEPGREVTLTARLLPPGPPVAPGAFDFQRHAYFQGIGAVGFAYRIDGLGPAPPWWRSAVPALRARVNAEITGALSGARAAMAMALITGTKTAMDPADKEAMRNAGLAHMLAISGLHVGMVAGIVFFAVRLALAAWPALALTRPIKKYAAGAALAAAVFYMLLAGAPTSAQRATIMTGAVLLAVMADRWPFSLRVVAAAALAVLLVQPAALVSAGFQMSFAAVTALIYAFERARPALTGLYARGGVWLRVGLYFAGVLATDLVASAATTAFSAYHFQQVANYTLLGNFASAPLFTFVVMPAAVAAMAAMPLGLEAGPLWLMGLGIEGVLAIACWVSSLPGALHIPVAWPPGVLLAIAAFGVGLVLLRGWEKWVILVPLALWMAWAWAARPPDILVSPSGDLIGLYSQDGGLAVSSLKKESFARGVWERRAGLPLGSAVAWDLRCDADACRGKVAGRRLSFVKDSYAAREECAWADILLSPGDPLPRRLCLGPEVLIDRFDVYYRGAHAVYAGEGRVRSVGRERGRRPWTARNGE